MAQQKLQTFTGWPDKKNNFVVPIALLWGLVLLTGMAFLWFETDLGNSFRDYYLIPWVAATGVIILFPSVYLFYKKKFDLFHPLVFAAWSYIFPAFVIGGLILAVGWSNPFFMSFIEDPEYNLPLSLVYVGVGFLGMTIGYFLPIGKFLSQKIEPRLPKWNWESPRVWGGGIFLVIAGVGINIFGFVEGLLGFQRSDEVGIFDGLVFFLVILLSEGMFMLWLAVFQTKKRSGIFYIVIFFLSLLIPLRMAFLGSRGSLLLGVIPIGMAFQYSGRKIKWLHGAVFGVILFLAVFIGMLYGTTFRNIKGSEARISSGDYFGQVAATLDYLSNHELDDIIKENAVSLAERMENLSSLGVVVANYEKLAPYEASYGLENNIIKDSYTSFIPRFLWSEKPPTSDARAYSDLYFNFGDNSFAITPFGDLLRNFGPLGVPLGMFVLGIYLRVLYSTLIDTPHPAMWKKVAYFSLLTVISYETFYATIFPTSFRTLFVLAASLFVVNLYVRRGKRAEI